MEKMEKEANVLSVEETLEAEKQEKINEVIQNAKAEESNLELMATGTPEQRFNWIRDQLADDSIEGDTRRLYEYKKEIELQASWDQFKDIRITFEKPNDPQWLLPTEEYIHIKFEYKNNKKKINKREKYDFCVKKTSDSDNNTIIKYKDGKRPWGYHDINQNLLCRKLELAYRLVNSSQFEDAVEPQDGSWFFF